MKKYIIALMTLSFSCSSEVTTDPCSAFDRIDREMLDLISEIETKNANKKEFLKAFKMEQVYWIQYRDRHLRAVYPKDWDRYYRKEFGKDVFNPCKCMEMTRMTRRRIEDLQVFTTNSPDEQKNCPSIWNEEGE
ncbi:MAG: hypothetical protein Tsb0034_18410 [Ekhidna sp.]